MMLVKKSSFGQFIITETQKYIWFSNIIFLMNHLSKKRQQFAKELRFNNREIIKSQIRQKTYIKNNIQRPLISDVFQKYLNCTHFQLMNLTSQLKQAIEDTPIQSLNDDQHDQFITDLFYLYHQHLLELPQTTKFKKNQSIYTASFVAISSNNIIQEQLVYWIRYMSDQDKSMMFMGINPYQFSHQKWVHNQILFMELINSVKYSQEAALSLKELLTLSQEIQKKHVDICVGSIKNALAYNQNSQNIELKRQILSIWIHIIKIYVGITVHARQTKEMMQILKIYVNKRIQIIMECSVLADMNQLWEKVAQDVIQSQNSELLMKMAVDGGVKNIGKEQTELFKCYLCRFFYNNWRMKQLFSKPFAYSSQFYQLLQKLIDQQSLNPFHQKLLSIRPKY